MSRKNGTRYTKEYKEMVITRMMPSNNERIKALVKNWGYSNSRFKVLLEKIGIQSSYSDRE